MTTSPSPAKDAVIQRRVLVGTVSNVANKVFALGIGFFLTPFILHLLGPVVYGLWILVGSVVAYGTLLDFGVAQAVTKYVADYQARGQLPEVRPLLATALWLYTLLGLLAVGLSVVVAPIFPSVFAVPADQHALAQSLVLWSGLTLGVSLPCAIPVAVLRGLQRFDLVSLLGAVGTALFTILTVVVLLAGWGALGLVVISIPVTLLLQVPTLWLIHRAAPELRLGYGGASLGLLRLVWSYSSALLVINVAGRLQSRTDEVVIGAFLPVANVTPYSLARRLSEIPNTFTDQFIRVLMPLAAQLHAEDDQQRLRALYVTSTRLTLAIGLPLVLGLIVFSRPFLALWVGPEYVDTAPLVIVLVVASLIDTTQWPASNILQGMARHRPLAYIALATGVANLILSLALVRPFGLMGVALGTLIPAVIEGWALITPYTLRQLGLSVRTVVGQVLWPVLAPVAPFLLMVWGLSLLVPPTSFLAIGLVGAAGVGLYGLVYLFLTRDQPEFLLVRRALRFARTRVARPATR